MKSAEDWLLESANTIHTLKDVVKMAQIEAYNEGIRDAAENAMVTNGERVDDSITTEYYGTIHVLEQSILKLLKDE